MIARRIESLFNCLDSRFPIPLFVYAGMVGICLKTGLSIHNERLLL